MSLSATPSPGTPPSDTPAGAPVTRFAPSPTGRLHLGHAHAALVAWDRARAGGGLFRLRIEDIDGDRCASTFEAGIFEDLSWLGLNWDGPVLRQSQRRDVYAEALTRLEDLGVVYPCFCSRKEIRAEVARAGAAPHGPLGPVYPGTCRGLSEADRAARKAAGAPYALRLDAAAAQAQVGRPIWIEGTQPPQPADLTAVGDVVIARKELSTSYHLAVVVDDAAQGVTLVTRGADLQDSTPIHRVLQALLDLPVPRWAHHALLTDDAGVRLAKRDDARSLAALRAAGYSPAEVRALAGFPDKSADHAPDSGAPRAGGAEPRGPCQGGL